MSDQRHLLTPVAPRASAAADEERALSQVLAEAEAPVPARDDRGHPLLLDLSEE